MFNTADRILNRIDSPSYFLYGGTNRRKICKNSFIGANIVLFKKTAKLLAVFLVYILFFLSEESFYSEKAVLKSLGLLLYFFSEESSRGRTGDANLHELSDMVVTLIDDNRLVLFCSTHHLFAATLAEVLDEDGEYLALILLVLFGAHLGLQLDKFVEAGYLGFFRNIVIQTVRQECDLIPIIALNTLNFLLPSSSHICNNLWLYNADFSVDIQPSFEFSNSPLAIITG